jgi:hypothetical protein
MFIGVKNVMINYTNMENEIYNFISIWFGIIWCFAMFYAIHNSKSGPEEIEYIPIKNKK